MGRVWVRLLGIQGPRARVILVLRECMWNVPEVSIVLPAFNDTGSLVYPPRQVIYPPGSTLGDGLPFLFTTTFPCFPVFLLLNPRHIVTLGFACWGYSLIIIIYSTHLLASAFRS